MQLRQEEQTPAEQLLPADEREGLGDGGKGRRSRSNMTSQALGSYLGVSLDDKSAHTLNKIVGSMTKDGKKSRAYRVLLNTMHVMRDQLKKASPPQ